MSAIAQKAENYLVGTGTGDTPYFGPELEHFTTFPSKQTFVSAGGTSAMSLGLAEYHGKTRPATRCG